METVHDPVMVAELLNLLQVKQDGVYCDVTLGNAGHAVEVLKKLGPKGFFFGLDQDSEILEVAEKRLASWERQVSMHQVNFADIAALLKEKEILCDGIYADLGVSSLQLDRGERGFSFKNEGPLDMRMNVQAGTSVLEKLKHSNVEELTKILREYGEERLAPKIARRIMEGIKMGSLNTTLELASLVAQIYPPFARHGRIHPATRTFQALRIWINDELTVLKKFLKTAPHCLKKEGRLCVMTYHSLEDRLVKHAFRAFAEDDAYEVLTKKPMTPGGEEIENNPRSRSAKLRGLLRKE